MSEQTKVLLRMRDVAFSLATSEVYSVNLSRIQLQKFIYLLDIVGFIYKIFPPKDAHQTYLHGPYDIAIQNAVDTLAFRGLVEVKSVKKSSNGQINANYSLTKSGDSWIKNLIDENQEFQQRYIAAKEVAKKVNHLGWNRLVALVYAEPTFINRKAVGNGQSLDITNSLDSSSAFLLQLIEKSLKVELGEVPFTRELVTEMFFNYLDKFSRLQESKNAQQSNNFTPEELD